MEIINKIIEKFYENASTTSFNISDNFIRDLQKRKLNRKDIKI